jgi:hypothetical protein
MDMHLQEVKEHRVIVRGAESFACTHYSLPMQTVIKRPHYNDLHGPSGKDFAKEAAEKSLQTNEEVNMRRQEQEEKALVRHRHALAQIRMEKAHKEGLQELEQLERQYRSSRQKIVTELPQNLFQPAQRQIDIKKEKQREMERAFERPFVKRSGPQYAMDFTDGSSVLTRTVVEDVTSGEESDVTSVTQDEESSPNSSLSEDVSVTSTSPSTSPSPPVQAQQVQPETLSIGDMDSHFTESPSSVATESTADKSSQGSPRGVLPLSIGEVDSVQTTTEVQSSGSEEETDEDSIQQNGIQQQTLVAIPPPLPTADVVGDGRQDLNDSTCSTPNAHTHITSIISSVDTSYTCTSSEQSLHDNSINRTTLCGDGREGYGSQLPLMAVADGPGNGPSVTDHEGYHPSEEDLQEHGTSLVDDQRENTLHTSDCDSSSLHTSDCDSSPLNTFHRGKNPRHGDNQGGLFTHVNNPQHLTPEGELVHHSKDSQSESSQMQGLPVQPSTVENELDAAAHRMSVLLAEICSRQDTWMQVNSNNHDGPIHTNAADIHQDSQQQMKPLTNESLQDEDTGTPPSTPLSVSTLLSSVSLDSDSDATLTPSPSICSTQSWSSLQEVHDDHSLLHRPSIWGFPHSEHSQSNMYSSMPPVKSPILPSFAQLSSSSPYPAVHHPPLMERVPMPDTTGPAPDTSLSVQGHAPDVNPSSAIHYSTNYLPRTVDSPAVIKPTVSPSMTVELPLSSSIDHSNSSFQNSQSLLYSPLLSVSDSSSVMVTPLVVPLSHSDRPTAPPRTTHIAVPSPLLQTSTHTAQPTTLHVPHSGTQPVSTENENVAMVSTNTMPASTELLYPTENTSYLDKHNTTTNVYSPGLVHFAPERSESPKFLTMPSAPLAFVPVDTSNSFSSAAYLVPSPSMQAPLTTYTTAVSDKPYQSLPPSAYQDDTPHKSLLMDPYSLSSSNTASTFLSNDLQSSDIGDSLFVDPTLHQSPSELSSLSSLSLLTPSSVIQSLLTGQHHKSTPVAPHGPPDAPPDHDTYSEELTSDISSLKSVSAAEEVPNTRHQNVTEECSILPVLVDSGSRVSRVGQLNVTPVAVAFEYARPEPENSSEHEGNSTTSSSREGRSMQEGETKSTMSLQEAFLLKRKAFIRHSEQRKQESKLKIPPSPKLLTKAKSHSHPAAESKSSSAKSKRSVTFSSPVTVVQSTGLFSPPEIHNHKGTMEKETKFPSKEGAKSAQQRKISKREMLAVNQRLYNQLAEVRQRKAEEERSKAYQTNRAKAKEYQKMLREKLKHKQKSTPTPTEKARTPPKQKPFK